MPDPERLHRFGFESLDSDKRQGEWKMPRLAKLLAAGAFVVSEGACGVEHRRAAYAGVVFTDDLVGDLMILARLRPVERPRVAGQAFSTQDCKRWPGPVERGLNSDCVT